MIPSNSGDQVALAVDGHKPIPGYMKHGRDNYIPLDRRPPPLSIWPYAVATMITMGCVFFVIAYIWRA